MIDEGFTFISGVCSARDYTNISTPQNLSIDICAYNRSSEWYTEQNETMGDWNLYDIDSNSRGYYYHESFPYFYQMLANESDINFTAFEMNDEDQWLWAIGEYVSNPFPNGFCIMLFADQTIHDCQQWYLFNNTADEYILSTYAVLPYECPLVAQLGGTDICIYNSQFSIYTFFTLIHMCFCLSDV